MGSNFAGQFGGTLVDRMDFGGEIEFTENDAGTAEGIGLNHVGAGLEIGGVNIFNNVGTAEDQHFRTVLFAPEVIERGIALLYLSAHRAVIDDDTFANCFQKGFHLRKSRPFLLPLPVGVPAVSFIVKAVGSLPARVNHRAVETWALPVACTMLMLFALTAFPTVWPFRLDGVLDIRRWNVQNATANPLRQGNSPIRQLLRRQPLIQCLLYYLRPARDWGQTRMSARCRLNRQWLKRQLPDVCGTAPGSLKRRVGNASLVAAPLWEVAPGRVTW